MSEQNVLIDPTEQPLSDDDRTKVSNAYDELVGNATHVQDADASDAYLYSRYSAAISNPAQLGDAHLAVGMMVAGAIHNPNLAQGALEVVTAQSLSLEDQQALREVTDLGGYMRLQNATPDQRRQQVDQALWGRLNAIREAHSSGEQPARIALQRALLAYGAGVSSYDPARAAEYKRALDDVL